MRDRGAWNSYLSYFMEGIATQCRETIAFTQTCLKLEGEIRAKVKGVTRQASVHRVLEQFFKMPILRVSEAVRSSGVSHNTAQRAIDVLISLQVVAEITGQRKGRLYVCRPIYDLIFIAKSANAPPNSARPSEAGEG